MFKTAADMKSVLLIALIATLLAGILGASLNVDPLASPSSSSPGSAGNVDHERTFGLWTLFAFPYLKKLFKQYFYSMG